MFQEEDMVGLTNKIRRLVEHASQQLMQSTGLRRVELEILLYLSRCRGGDTARDIIEARNLSKSHISKSVYNLRRTGCLTLQEDPGDRRCLHLKLTPKGRRYAGYYAGVLHRVGGQMMAGVTPSERTVLRGVLDKIRHNVESADNTNRTQLERPEEML